LLIEIIPFQFSRPGITITEKKTKEKRFSGVVAHSPGNIKVRLRLSTLTFPSLRAMKKSQQLKLLFCYSVKLNASL
jgi:hypothetical protein